jgi:hypothetical protein
MLTLCLTKACAFDWDHLEPKGTAQMTGGAGSGGQGVGGKATGGAGGTGGVSPGGGGLASAGANAGGAGSVPQCSANVLPNPGFEVEKPKGYPDQWALITQDNGTGAIWGRDPLSQSGTGALRLDTRTVSVSGPAAYRAVVGTALTALVPVAQSTQVTQTIALRVEALTQDKVSLIAYFKTASGPVEVEVGSLTTAAQKYVTVGGTVDVPKGATAMGLEVAAPDMALVYVDDACAELQ